MDYSVHLPSNFIRSQTHRLLPDWSVAVGSVLVVLQACPVPLLKVTAETERLKDELRDRFLEVARQVAEELHSLGHQVEIFDPRTGLPIFSSPGSLRLDDVAVVRACLGYGAIDQGDCRVTLHPLWDSAVYPSVLLSSAVPEALQAIADRVLACHHS
ncbi:hypothetical protein BST81_05345 [Leptolyngbya sp. 'hensonii']|uniref:methylmalonic aciduria and homocystinuria type D protein n=1 Tax=Leptolyngbya sp. 'hensonii' TaxID=1922337 RepID=UPI00094F88CC|nr:methylmalonic aciduria and homocystinuria type D protein [Leptolyngbya sp. 'hensonii']OLP19452.1 hypothetical protein BST81_05345 [Leptolyngbya sp. 'hensonii']